MGVGEGGEIMGVDIGKKMWLKFICGKCIVEDDEEEGIWWKW